MKKQRLTFKEIVIKTWFAINGINLVFYENPCDDRENYQPYATAFVLGKPECPPHILMNWDGDEQSWSWKHWFVYSSPTELKR